MLSFFCHSDFGENTARTRNDQYSPKSLLQARQRLMTTYTYTSSGQSISHSCARVPVIQLGARVPMCAYVIILQVRLFRELILTNVGFREINLIYHIPFRQCGADLSDGMCYLICYFGCLGPLLMLCDLWLF